MNLNPVHYASLAEIVAAIQTKWTTAPQTSCSLPLNFVKFDTGPIVMSMGVDIQHRHTLNFTTFWGPGCTYQTAYTPTTIQTREATCRAGYIPVYEAGPPVVGPHCALEWTKADEDKSAGRSCQVTKGNPCEIGSGNKYQVERDYVGRSVGGLTFTRYYNSLPAKNYQFTSSAPRWEALGTGWSADYFQRIEYFNYGSMPSAFVTRPDGQRLAFNASGSAFVPSQDVAMQLAGQRDGSGTIIGWTLTTTDDLTETYDATGKLLSIRSRGGLTLTAQYDSAGRLASVTDSFGEQLQFTFDANRRLTKVTDPAGGVIQYAYSSANNLLSATYQDTRVRQYHYEGSWPNLLTGITDENVQRHSTYAYDSSTGYVISTELAGGVAKYQIARGAGTRTVTDPLNTVRTYNFSLLLNVHRVTASTAVCPGCGESKATTYDSNANVASRTDFNNNETRYVHDLTRNLETSRTEASGTPKARTITTAWHAAYRLPTQIDEPNRRTTFTHDANGNVLTRTVTDLATSASRTWTYTYNSFGQLLTENGPRTDVSDVTTYTYYTCTTGFQCGQVNTITNALGHVTTYNTYNAHGQALTITDPNGVVTTLTYDLRQRITSRDVGGETTTFEYWPTGLLKKVTLPDTSYLQYTYDAAHRLTQIADHDSNRIVYTLDAMGNRTKEETFDPSNFLVRLQHRAFNTLNQLWKEIGSANTAAVTTTFGYDNNGNQTSAAAPLSRNSSNLYDELNRLKQITDPASGVTLFGYDPNDHLTSVTDPRGKVTSYAYNGFGDLTQQTSPDTGVTNNTYDSGGNLDTSTDARGKTGDYAYDALNRVTQLLYPDQTIAYTYDTGTNNQGRLMQVTDGSGSTSWTYTTLGRVATRTQVMGSVTKAVGYGYNSVGQLTTLTTPSGQTVTYGYTGNRLLSVTVNSTPVLSNVLYDPFGPVRQWTWGNSTLAVRSFDADGNVDQIDSAGLKTYAQDDAFRITGITDASDPALSWSYGYDLLDRLTSGNKTGQSQTWTYDANGNRLTQGGTASSTYTISSISNRLSSVSGALTRTYGYDAAGNTTSYGGFTFAYNDAGRMTSVSGGATASYAHNALGQRVRKTVGGVSTYFVYDEAGRLIGEYDGSGALIQETVWLDDAPVATLRPNGGGVSIFYIHTDHLNTPRKVSRPSDSAILWRWDSDAFGTDAANQDPDGDTVVFVYGLRFPGQYFDSETQLNYNYFRDYDPATGRYPQSDPIGLAAGVNTFSYAGQSPLMWSDPTGTEAVSEMHRRGWGLYPPDEQKQRDCARAAFARNFYAMLAANWKKQDKYFHCKANCEAARCGKYGYDEACRASAERESYDQVFKGDTPADSTADEAANRHGRDNAVKNPTQTCQLICARYRPRGLPPQY